MRTPALVPVLATAVACLLTVRAAESAQQCQGTPARAATDFTLLAGGTQILDQKTGLIWRRCLEGQRWNGSTCQAVDPQAVNPGPRMTFAQAQQLAASASTPDEKWRLPSKRELLTIREPGCYNPSFSLALFPSDPAWSSDGSFWTSTREADGVSVVSAIGTSDGWDATTPGKTNHVRLVRDAPPPAK